MAMTLNFHIEHPGEIGAGIHSYTEEVAIKVESGDPGGEDGEFAEYMRGFIAEWFDGASVELVQKEIE